MKRAIIGLMLIFFSIQIMPSLILPGSAQRRMKIAVARSQTQAGDGFTSSSIIPASARRGATDSATTQQGELTLQPAQVDGTQVGQEAPDATSACVPRIITHSTSQAITTDNSIACTNDTGHTAANSYWRAFNLPTQFGINKVYNVSRVQIGIEAAVPGGSATSQTLGLRLYRTTSGTFPTGTRTQIGNSFGFNIPAIFNSVVSLNFTTVAVPAGSELIVEIVIPDGQAAGNFFFLGSNTAPETGPSYLSAATCGINQPTDLAVIGFPNVNWVINVDGCVVGDNARLFDFTLDGRADVSVYRPLPDGSLWRVRNSTSGAVTETPWGKNTDRLVPGDYDGDGIFDRAVWRPDEGNWYIVPSSGAPILVKGWGVSTDIPVPADYDGDGFTDIAVFRPSEANWYIINSNGGVGTIVHWGLSTDKLVPADYDGDGKADPAVWRASEANWYVKQSSGGATVRNWGLSTDRPVPGDYDGDGKSDLAVYRPSDANWYIIHSFTNSGFIRNWGLSTDILVPADYDKDGKTDIAVYRPSEANWYIISSFNGAGILLNLGGGLDVPIPSVRVP